MKKILLATVAGAMFALPSLAETTAVTPAGETAAVAGTPSETPAPAKVFYDTVPAGLLATAFIGKSIHAASTLPPTGTALKRADAGDEIGSVGDVVFAPGGDIEAVLVDVGGFLGIGAKTVAVDLSALEMVPDADAAGDYIIVMKGDRAALEAAPEYKPANAPVPATMPSEPTTATSDSTANMKADPQPADTAQAETPKDVPDWATVTSEDLTGSTVYGLNDNRIGEVSKVLMTADMHVEKIIVDVGGFLGLGEHPIALDPAQVDLQRDKDGKLMLHVDATEDALEKMPAYEG